MCPSNHRPGLSRTAFLVISGDEVLQAAAVASATQQQLQLQTAQAHINNVAAAAQQTQVKSRVARPTDQAKFEFNKFVNSAG